MGPFITCSAALSVGSNNNNIQLSEKEIKFQILSPYRECLLMAPLIKIFSTSERKLNQGGQLPCALSPPMNESARAALIYWGKEWFPRGKKCIWNKSPVSLQREQKTISIPAQVQEKISLQCYQRCSKSPTWRRIKVVLWAVDPARGAGTCGRECRDGGMQIKFIFWQNQKTCWAPCGMCEMSLVLDGNLDSQDLLRETIPTHTEVPGEVRKAGNQENTVISWL